MSYKIAFISLGIPHCGDHSQLVGSGTHGAACDPAACSLIKIRKRSDPMSYKIAFISLGCAKNQVNCEQMMSAVQAAGHTIVSAPERADVAVVNTCGFLASACEEAIDNILEMAELKKAGQGRMWRW